MRVAREMSVAKHGRPFSESKVGDDDDRAPLTEFADEMERQLTAGPGEKQIAELVEDDKVAPSKLLGPACPCAPRS